jgi:hypothetical protein
MRTLTLTLACLTLISGCAVEPAVFTDGAPDDASADDAYDVVFDADGGEDGSDDGSDDDSVSFDSDKITVDEVTGSGGPDDHVPDDGASLDTCNTAVGNPSCADLGLSTAALIEQVSSGTYGPITLVTDGAIASFISTDAIQAVIVKGGPDAIICGYALGTMGEQDLWAAINPNTGHPYGISHLEFCEN